MMLNDTILRVAFEHGLPAIDLRLICSERADYANPIEPSVHGGAKISRAIRSFLLGGSEERSRVIASAR